MHYYLDEDGKWKVNLFKRPPPSPTRTSSVQRDEVADYFGRALAEGPHEDPNELTVLGLSGEARRVRVRHYG